MDLNDDPNQYEDITVPVGCDLVWGFSLEPWDANGATCVFLVEVTNSYPVTVDIGGEDDDPISSFFVHLTPAQLATLKLNVPGALASYVVQITNTDGTVQQIGHGLILAS